MKTISLRTRFVAIVLAGVILPLAIVGAWLARSSIETTTRRLQDQLVQQLDSVRAGIERRWQYRLGDILLLAENEEALAFLRSKSAPSPATVAFLDSIWSPIRHQLPTIEYRAANGRALWRFNASEDEPAERGTRALTQTIAVRLPVRDPQTKQTVGEVLAHVRAASLTQDSIVLAMRGARFLIRHRPTGAALAVTTELPPGAQRANRFKYDGQRWIAARSRIADPEIDLSAAVPITQYIAPYQRAARIGAIALIAVAIVVSLLLFFLATRMTRGLEQLASATETLSAGDLGVRVAATGGDEVGRVGVVFNRMAESLERTLGELAHQRALATIGEFAATLSHEVRNALTSVRIDLERAGLAHTDDRTRHQLAERALANATRLEHIVTGLLRVARSGQTTLKPVNVLDSLRAAISAVLVQSPNGGITIDDRAATNTVIAGDSAALEQLFTNLILNAVETSDTADQAGRNHDVKIVVRNEGASVVTDVRDNGPGIAPDRVESVFQAFITTKPNGTGLGLPIARNIARSMNGNVRIAESTPSGTTMRVTFPFSMDQPALSRS